MKSQQELWQDEHISPQIFNRMHLDKPSSPVVMLVDFLKNKGLSPNQTYILDMGCGKGRNSFYLASESIRVLGVDFASQAIDKAKEKNQGNYGDLKFEVSDVINQWSYEDNLFDVIIDCNTTICIPNPGRQTAILESYRVLKPNGYYLFYGIGPTEFVNRFPGPEPNSTIFPKTGKFEKQYSEDELKEAYKDFKIIQLDTKIGSDKIEGEETSYVMWIGIFQK